VTAEGTLVVDGRARSLADPRALSALRGSAVGLVPQAAVESLDPVRRIDRQLREIVARHRTARSPAELAARVGLPTAALALHPAGLSGGMAQKAALALALAAGPRVLLCDEPTASLDNVAQAEVLDLLAQTCAREQAALLLVSHDLGLLARVCDRVLVLIDGQLVHDAGIPEVLASSDPGVRRLVLAGRAARARLGGGGR
jgi:ABC-type glutathione transport system ATPase component